MRSAIAEADRTTAHQIAAVLKEVCQNGYAERTKIWSELSPMEQQQFQSLLAPPPIVRDFAKKIKESISYQSPAVATAVQNDLEDASDAGKLTAADVWAIVGAAEFARFERLMSFQGTS